ncbi:molybdate transport system ATP-binding protein [Dysgonomonas sp. PFB1-18]|uniref:ATP-binding cassette domain-containing protein n=1 Tax=unclassified Dysgonomonas TaxID=2630389 RepID=UPI002476500E|nr:MULTISPECIES: ATP-binding cassette domain-containing protein [unclassified Dysgonomonas]MDH6307761.1 molybdate transport system ATP-binding protein [Dysgonomonas sp. PF1-14]MDH6337679.1 molybdate transport system ATP-binding protein [Dysgonomonas sp. PF1-16]MDH6378903.1 molybdate transport system ATP-binding protein [Dysgonomonas sp. PFB1-18]MDH6396538.1 molybdate transport system ATP-binding protein [Dysgonomonas sp. PF1-23]
MQQKEIIKIADAVPRLEHLRFVSPVNWQIKEGEHWAIIGSNGSGKTLLTDLLLGKYALKEGEISYKKDGGEQSVSSVVKSVAFKDIYSIIDTQNSYYQQRWNKGDEQEVPLVKDLVTKVDAEWLATLVEWFGIAELMEKQVNLLSSGELRKFLIVRSLLSKPRILILDNPFIGLDAASRIVLNDLFVRLSELDNLQIVLVLSNPQDIPDMITNVLPVYQKQLLAPLSGKEFLANKELQQLLFGYAETEISNISTTYIVDNAQYEYAAVLKNIHIKYDNRTILDNLNWQVRRGEKWALLGVNGSGKSTLLSLICGDNPQAYANDITLFDRKRGTGESIWDIKKRIGYISPEMHLYYLKNVCCLDVVGSGFYDTIGLYKKYDERQRKIALEWMALLGVEQLKDVSFLNISSGEQRLVLLARVFVKNPDLLILDEPLHGLDIANKRRIKALIEHFCGKDKSLIYVTHYQDEIPDVVDKQLVLTKKSLC